MSSIVSVNCTWRLIVFPDVVLTNTCIFSECDCCQSLHTPHQEKSERVTQQLFFEIIEKPEKENNQKAKKKWLSENVKKIGQKSCTFSHHKKVFFVGKNEERIKKISKLPKIQFALPSHSQSYQQQRKKQRQPRRPRKHEQCPKKPKPN
jgi:hypothetical protein